MLVVQIFPTMILLGLKVFCNHRSSIKLRRWSSCLVIMILPRKLQKLLLRLSHTCDMLSTLSFYTPSLSTVSLHTCHHILTTFLARCVETSQHTSHCVVLCTVCQGVRKKGKFAEFFRIKSILNKILRSMCQMKVQINGEIISQ